MTTALVQRINNNGWRCARRSVGLSQVRVHDLKHTYGRRLRAAGVPLETRRALLGHKNGDITTHYSAPELQELIDAAERVCQEDFGKTSAMTLLKKKADATRTATCWGDQAFVSSAGCPAVSRFRKCSSAHSRS